MDQEPDFDLEKAHRYFSAFYTRLEMT